MSEFELGRLRPIALALPEVNERLSHGAPCFFIRDRRPLCYFHDHDYDDRGRPSLMCPAPPGLAESVARARPARFYRPAPSANGVFGDWLGMFLDEASDDPIMWDEVADLVRDAYRLVAPKALVTRLDAR